MLFKAQSSFVYIFLDVVLIQPCNAKKPSAQTLKPSKQVKDARVERKTKHHLANICRVMIDPQDQHNHNEIPSKSHLIDLNNTVKCFLPGQC